MMRAGPCRETARLKQDSFWQWRSHQADAHGNEFSATPSLSDLAFVTFHDADWAVRRDGKSQAGFIFAVAQPASLKGARSPTSPMLMVSKECPRVVPSSMRCDVHSGNMADKEATFTT